MMEQFVEIKAANPDSLLFYRMGDFYELFFADAVKASKALGITLTKRGKHLGEDIPMCGVPVHAAEDYLNRLIGLGYRVAVCEQLENPAEAKKRGAKSVVKRDVVRLVTPGTITEEKLLDPSQSSFLAAIGRVRKGEQEDELALAWIELSTGDFRIQPVAVSELGTALARIDPRELILPDTMLQDDKYRQIIELQNGALSPLPSNLFDSQSAVERMTDFYQVKTLDGFGNFSRAELSAAGALLAYVEKTQIGERPALARPTREASGDTMFIDAATRANLELTKTLSGEKKGSLISAIDKTVTGVGGRLLATRLMSPLTNAEWINHRLDSVEFFTREGTYCRKLRDMLNHCPDMPRALSRLALNRGGPRDMGVIARGVNAAHEIAASLEGRELPAELDEAQNRLKQLPNSLMEHLNRALSDELGLLKRDGGFVRSGYNEELDELRTLRDESRRVIAGMQAEYAQETGVKGLKIKHNNVLGYFIEVTAQNSNALTTDEAKARFIHRQTLANVMRFTTTDLADIESKIANAAGRALQIEFEIFDQLLTEIISHADAIKLASNALATLDVSQAFGTLADARDYCRPLVDESLAFNLEKARHPVVEQVLANGGSNPFVANDCDIGPVNNEKSGCIWLLTGPNMGGKSTFLRQNALIAILAQAGCFVPAESAHIGIVDRLFSRVGAADDLARGRSTFMVEMVETAAILNQAGERSLVILDEIGRGTATFDGLSIAWAAIEHLHEGNKCRTLFATHYHELTALSEPLARLSNVTLKVKEWNGDVIFLHEVVPGAADRSYGIQVAKLAGLPDPVIARARDVLDQLENAERNNSASKLVDDLPLFSIEQKPASSKSATTNALKEAIDAISPDELTPREAHDLLYELKAKARD
ncbi:MAG: DNA mismatch repair protein MutS [Hyphomicrobiales bacterium]|nr:MAG: DNA mismatch repair protein MutS [Hyphomicrobiales bacterium]